MVFSHQHTVSRWWRWHYLCAGRRWQCCAGPSPLCSASDQICQCWCRAKYAWLPLTGRNDWTSPVYMRRYIRLSCRCHPPSCTETRISSAKMPYFQVISDVFIWLWPSFRCDYHLYTCKKLTAPSVQRAVCPCLSVSILSHSLQNLLSAFVHTKL